MINDGYGRFPPGSFMGRPEQMRINVQWGPPRERFQGMESLCTITPCVCLQWVSAHTDTSRWTPPQHLTILQCTAIIVEMWEKLEQKLGKLLWKSSSTQCCSCGQLWNLLLPLLWEKVEDVSSFGPVWAFWLQLHWDLHSLDSASMPQMLSSYHYSLLNTGISSFYIYLFNIVAEN